MSDLELNQKEKAYAKQLAENSNISEHYIQNEYRSTIMQREQEYIKQLSTKIGIPQQDLYRSLETGEWSQPIKNFPLDKKGNLTADSAIRLARNEKNHIILQASPLQKFQNAQIIDIDKIKITGTSPTINDAGNDFSFKLGNTQLSGTILDDHGKTKLQIEGYYGPNPNLTLFKDKNSSAVHNPEIEKVLNDLEPSQSPKIQNKVNLNDKQIQQKINLPPNSQIKTAQNIDPVVQTQLLINNIALLIKLGIPKPKIDLITRQNIDKQLDDKQESPILQLTAQEKDEIKSYLSGQRQSHTVAIGDVQEKNKEAQETSIIMSQSEVDNLKGYIGTPNLSNETSQIKSNRFDSKVLDSYIVSLKEMMDKNIPLPQPLSPQFKDALVQTLNSKNKFAVDPKYNVTTAKDLKNQQKSSHQIGMGLPKRKNQEISHS